MDEQNTVFLRIAQLTAMDKLLSAAPECDALKGWRAYLKDKTVSDVAENDKQYRACCDYFAYAIAKTKWRVENV